MPIQVYIEVNGKPIKTVHIARDSGMGTNPDDVNTYLVVPRDALGGTSHTSQRYDLDMPRFSEWVNEGLPFQHRYGDGLEVCVEKALHALNNPPVQ